jgi:uncharacterized protein
LGALKLSRADAPGGRPGSMKLIASLFALYMLVCLVAYLGNRYFMYFPNPERIAPATVGLNGVEEVELVGGDGVKLVAWHAPARPDKSTILYFHGNGSNAAERAARIERMRQDGFGVLYLNNRGYGGSGGKPTEENNLADALKAYNHLRALGLRAKKIVAYGESLGSGQAIRLAAKKPLAAIILESPLTSTVDVARTTYFWLPLEWLITDKHNNESNIASVTAPVLVLHGEQALQAL